MEEGQRQRFCTGNDSGSKEERLVSSLEVEDNKLIQDRSQEMVIIGSDVVGLYPSMVGARAGQDCYQAVVDSGMKWEGVNYKEGARYLAVNWSKQRCRASRL